ncbi:hypothetical protein D7X74_21265 [Corallococcus sp. CA047B]|uniref:hypothetical protein n=1 Tax=Corallococcus sp. CA047B TaxID=2316729 RepID=UPI000EA36DAC|nr:hypothetical protein [Corallococcus sp. CA047B]RKH13780.1 hypothetical protein D7X74_21265 [Corallococcus sp. CA047B]
MHEQTTQVELTRKSLGNAIASKALTGPYETTNEDGSITQGFWHRTGHGGPLDCTGCAMEHLERLLPD